MEIHTLTPREYYRDMKWIIAPKNKIDTVTAKPYVGVLADPTNIATKNVTVMSVDGRSVNLPVTNDNKSTHFHMMHNKSDNILFTWNVAKARVEALVASGKVTFTLDEPLAEVPQVKLSFNGNSDIIARGSSSYNTYPNYSELSKETFDLNNWIRSHKNESTANVLPDFTGTQFSLNPWVKEIYPYIDESYPAVGLAPAGNSATLWNDFSTYPNGTGALYDNWTESVTDASKYPMVIAMPEQVAPPTDDYVSVKDQCLKMRNVQLNISTSLRKVDDYTYEVSFVAPVRYTYMAASNYGGIAGTEYDLDNYAYVSIVDSIDVSLYASSIDTHTEDIKYSLKNGVLSEDVSDTYPYNFAENPLIMRNTTWGEILWSRKVSEYLLNTYKNGKYVVECTVPARWALLNNIHVDSLTYVKLQNGNYISRKDARCVFRVTNIEKRFQGSAFVYALKLLEQDS